MTLNVETIDALAEIGTLTSGTLVLVGSTAPVSPLQTATAGQLAALVAPEAAALVGFPVTNVGLFSGLATVTPPAVATVLQTSGYSTAGVGAAKYALLTGGGYSANAYTVETADGRWWLLCESRPYVEMFNAKGDGATDDSAAFIAAAGFSATIGAPFYAAAKSYVISQEVRLDSGTAGLTGASFKGAGRGRTIILFKPAATTSRLFSFYGGSGDTTNKAASGFTAQPYSSAYTGMGVGICVSGQCFALCDDFEIRNFYDGIQLINEIAGAFTEFNTFTRFRVVDAARGAISFIVTNGNNSFHGNQFYADQLQLPDGGSGIYASGGATGAYIYECFFRLPLFGTTDSNDPYAINVTNANITKCKGDFTCEQNCQINIVNSGWAVEGTFFSTANVSFTAGSQANFYMDRVTGANNPIPTYPNFSNSNISAFAAAGIGALTLQDKVNTFGASIIAMYGSGLASVGALSYTGNADGFYVLEAGYGNALTGAVPRLFLKHDGSAIETYTSSSLDIRQGGQTGQLLLNNDRVGGAIGRSYSVVVPANAGVSQTVTLVNNAYARQNKSTCFMQLVDAGVQVDLRYSLDFCHDGYGNAGHIWNLVNPVTVKNPSTVTAPTFAVDSNGNLSLTMTTDRQINVNFTEISTGKVMTQMNGAN